MGEVAKCANPSHPSSRSSTKLCRSTGNASSNLKCSALLIIRSGNIWDLLNMSSKGQDNLRAIHGGYGGRISMNQTNKDSSPSTAPRGRDEGGGRFWGGLTGSAGEGGKGRGEPGCLCVEEEELEKGENKGSGLPLASLQLCRKARGLLNRTVARPLIARGTSFGGCPVPSASCKERGLRTQRWGLWGTQGETASTPTRGPAYPPRFMITGDAQSPDCAPAGSFAGGRRGWLSLAIPPPGPPHPGSAPLVAPRC